ncbi:helix-turn-helix domain-containing protein [Sphingobacterium pedocola]|uniref:HTH araC/xylS-type domain-containing protein n=1 Tax=Sphingobacterium pedocola TaxID=2082722 RepID=A0ABR9T6X1_9SPHI|nr:helix-turn-helix transcriptional regulator [Sphingobacterium pedocola]MBE8720814.1 hypothetical protein [Sphingobacterium pedocola]
MRKNIYQNINNNTKNDLEPKVLPSETQHKSFCFATFSQMDFFLQDARMLLNNGFVVVLFGAVKENTPYNKSMLLFFNQNDSRLEGCKDIIDHGQYFSFHPVLFKGNNLKSRFKRFGFLDYSTTESLLLKDEEQDIVKALIHLIAEESKNDADGMSADILFSYVELLLQHMNRFYQRWFNDRLEEIRAIDREYQELLIHTFKPNEKNTGRLPSLPVFARKLQLTSCYLNDISQIVSGQTAQERIEVKVIDVAKQLLASTNLSVAEIAERLGFSQPQSLNRLFKKNTQITPLEYRISIT